MSTDDLCWRPAIELKALIARREVSVGEVADAVIARIERLNPDLNAIVNFDPDQVRADARHLDDQAARSDDLPALFGVPYTLKEGCAREGARATVGLRPLEHSVCAADSAVARRLKLAGGLYLGQTNISEAGYCGGSANHVYGATQNPWKRGLTAGGSSSGAGAAVAAGLGQLAQGTDGGGSVRIPAAMNGVVGLKPSTGRIPQTALAGRFHSFIAHGPLARTVGDIALMLDVLAGPDSSDPLSLPAHPAFLRDLSPVEGIRIAWSKDLGLVSVDPEIAALCAHAARLFEQLGCTVEAAEPDFAGAADAMWSGVWAPAYSLLGDICEWSDWRGEVDEEFLELLAEGRALSGIEIMRADAARGRLWDNFARFMEDYDLLICPTLASKPFPVGRFCPDHLEGRPLRDRLLGWLLTYPFNMLGNPVISVPAGWTDDGLPVGVQLIGAMHRDDLVLRAAATLEMLQPWSRRPEPFH